MPTIRTVMTGSVVVPLPREGSATRTAAILVGNNGHSARFGCAVDDLAAAYTQKSFGGLVPEVFVDSSGRASIAFDVTGLSIDICGATKRDLKTEDPDASNSLVHEHPDVTPPIATVLTDASLASLGHVPNLSAIYPGLTLNPESPIERALQSKLALDRGRLQALRPKNASQLLGRWTLPGRETKQQVSLGFEWTHDIDYNDRFSVRFKRGSEVLFSILLRSRTGQTVETSYFALCWCEPPATEEQRNAQRESQLDYLAFLPLVSEGSAIDPPRYHGSGFVKLGGEECGGSWAFMS